MFVRRDVHGKIVGAFANQQDGFADEWVADDSPDLLAFYAPPELALQEANAKRDSLLALAAIRIAPRQDAVDLGRATPDQVSELLAWKNYRVDLLEVDQQAGFPGQVVWPLYPSDSVAE